MYTAIFRLQRAAPAPVWHSCAHDTAMDMSGDNIKPRIIRNYDGNDIVLNEEKHIVTAVSVFPNLKTFVGQDLIVTDGTTLLGADDKAGVAEIMTLAEFLMQNPDYPASAGFHPVHSG